MNAGTPLETMTEWLAEHPSLHIRTHTLRVLPRTTVSLIGVRCEIHSLHYDGPLVVATGRSMEAVLVAAIRSYDSAVSAIRTSGHDVATRVHVDAIATQPAVPPPTAPRAEPAITSSNAGV
jgi:hypothetical protein